MGLLWNPRMRRSQEVVLRGATGSQPYIPRYGEQSSGSDDVYSEHKGVYTTIASYSFNNRLLRSCDVLVISRYLSDESLYEAAHKHERCVQCTVLYLRLIQKIELF